MKTLQNKSFTEEELKAEGVNSYAKLLTICLNNSPERGFALDTMRIRLKILDKLDKSDEVIELEDSEGTECITAIDSMQWVRLSKEILEFCDEVKKSFN